MSKFKAIGFDWSGVVFFHAMKYHQAAGDFLKITKEEFSKVYFKHNHLINIKETSEAEFWPIIFKELGRESEVEEFLNMLHSLPKGRMNDEILPLIQRLKEKGYKVGLLSNNSKAGAEEARAHGVDDLFEVALFSAEVGLMKPDPEVFKLLAGKLGVDITQMIFIDDAQKSLERAEEAGYQPILYTDVKSLIEELKRLEILSEEETKNIC